MKKLLLLLFIPLMSCDMSSTGVVGVIMSDNDVEEYSGTEAEDELTELVLELAEDYTKADFEEAKEYYSDNVKIYFNSTEVVGKENLINGWTYEHEVFSDITISDEYAHTNYFNNGQVWTNHWFVNTTTGNYTKKTTSARAHTDLKWEDGKVVIFQVYYDPTFQIKEATAMAEMSK